jgi:hypothetical protein
MSILMCTEKTVGCMFVIFELVQDPDLGENVVILLSQRTQLLSVFETKHSSYIFCITYLLFNDVINISNYTAISE